MKFSLKDQKTRLIALILAISLGSLLLGAGGSYLLVSRHQGQVLLPHLITHADIPNQPMESFGQSLQTNFPADLGSYNSNGCPALPANWVAQENQKPGVHMTSSDWSSLTLYNAKGSALWLDKSSVTCGDEVSIHASLYESEKNPIPTGPRHFEAWRIGYYGGSGARQVWSSQPVTLKQYKVTTSKDGTLYTEAEWPKTMSFTIGQDWTPGFYLLLSFSPTGKIENAAPLVVRSPIGSSSLVMMQSILTWTMYDSFGGRSAYSGPGADGQADENERSRVASMDRPLVGSGAFAVQRDAIPFIQFSEKNGINIDQVTDLDIDQTPSLLTHYNGVILGGHAEYFTHRMFQSFVAARNHGINIAVFGANTAYWQTRLAPSPTGPNRHAIMYRSSTQDPDTNLSDVTIEFANTRLNTPPSLFTGEETDGVHVYGNLNAVSIPSWLNLPSGAMIKDITADTEAEAIKPTLASPPNIHVIFSGNLHWRDPKHDTSIKTPPVGQTSWFTTPSGAAVFNAGLTTWSCNLSTSCGDVMYSPEGQKTVQAATLAVLTLWQKPQLGKELK